MGLCICIKWQFGAQSISDIIFIHFGDDFRGVKQIKERNLGRDLKGIEPGPIPCRNEALLTVLIGPPCLKGQPTFLYTIGSTHTAAFRAGVGLGMSGCGNLGSVGQLMGGCRLGYIRFDCNVRTRCQHAGRPTTTGHDQGHYSLGNVSGMPGQGADSGARTTRIQKQAVELRH